MKKVIKKDLIEMNFDVDNVEKAFKSYLVNYDLSDERINLKVVHTYGVVNAMDYLCSKLKLSSSDKNLALLIAYLHDIGRFEQLKRFNSFEVESEMNHADFGVKILFDEGLIDSFVSLEEDEKEIVRKAIAYHNKYKLDETRFSDRESLFAKLIRDADKLDNFRVKNVEKFETLLGCMREDLEKENISSDVLRQFLDAKVVKNDTRKTCLDMWISYVAYIFDLEFKESFEFINDNDYINKVMNRLVPSDDMVRKDYECARSFALDYVQKKVMCD